MRTDGKPVDRYRPTVYLSFMHNPLKQKKELAPDASLGLPTLNWTER